MKGLRIQNLNNWNFMIDEVTADRFRIRHFGKTPNGIYNGKLGTLARPDSGTEYEISVSDFLLGEWTFGHLLGNMVGEDNDPVSFYKHFVDQWITIKPSMDGKQNA